jgi:hypothetical protein
MRLQHFIVACLNPQHNEPQCLDHIPFGMKIMSDCQISYVSLPACYSHVQCSSSWLWRQFHIGSSALLWTLSRLEMLSWSRHFECLRDLNWYYIFTKKKSLPFIHIRNRLDSVQHFTHYSSKISKVGSSLSVFLSKSFVLFTLTGAIPVLHV